MTLFVKSDRPNEHFESLDYTDPEKFDQMDLLERCYCLAKAAGTDCNRYQESLFVVFNELCFEDGVVRPIKIDPSRVTVR